METRSVIRKKIYIQVMKMAMAFALIILLLAVSCGESGNERYSVMKGPFKQTITETGELQAIDASFITMPRINYVYGYNFKVIGLEEHGKKVQKGDSIIKVDPSSIYKYIIEREESVENEMAAANKQAVQIENNLQDLEAQLKNEQAAYDLKKLELGRFSFESQSKRRVKELEFKQAELRLNKVKRKLSLRPKLDSLDFRIQKIRVMQKQAELLLARLTLKQMLIRSPNDGIFQVNMNYRTGQTIRVGDEIYLGAALANIPDTRWMKVMTFVNEADISKIFPGMKVIVRLDALPSVPFPGIISDIGKVCIQRDNEKKEKVFKVQVKITESDQRLKPGMTVSCEYICYESDKDLFVPSKCIFTENKHSYLFLKKGSSVKKVEVEKGLANSSHTIVKGDLKSGQALELPELYFNNLKN